MLYRFSHRTRYIKKRKKKEEENHDCWMQHTVASWNRYLRQIRVLRGNQEIHLACERASHWFQETPGIEWNKYTDNVLMYEVFSAPSIYQPCMNYFHFLLSAITRYQWDKKERLKTNALFSFNTVTHWCSKLKSSCASAMMKNVLIATCRTLRG